MANISTDSDGYRLNLGLRPNRRVLFSTSQLFQERGSGARGLEVGGRGTFDENWAGAGVRWAGAGGKKSEF